VETVQWLIEQGLVEAIPGEMPAMPIYQLTAKGKMLL